LYHTLCIIHFVSYTLYYRFCLFLPGLPTGDQWPANSTIFCGRLIRSKNLIHSPAITHHLSQLPTPTSSVLRSCSLAVLRSCGGTIRNSHIPNPNSQIANRKFYYLCAVIRQVDRFALIATTEKNAKTVSNRCFYNNPSLPLLNVKH